MNLVQEYKANYHKDRKAFNRLIEERAILFAVNMIRFSAKLPDSAEGIIVRNELAQAGTSIGASFTEANLARSRSDYGDNIKLCESDSGRTVYWLTIIGHLNWVSPEEMENELQEANEFLSLFKIMGKTIYDSSKK